MWNLLKFTAASCRRSRWLSTAIPGPCIVHKRGLIFYTILGSTRIPDFL
ncbi:hypothetical protein IC575_005195 [Cucumis melo]